MLQTQHCAETLLVFIFSAGTDPVGANDQYVPAKARVASASLRDFLHNLAELQLGNHTTNVVFVRMMGGGHHPQTTPATNPNPSSTTEPN
jgi:hypothetical protein